MRWLVLRAEEVRLLECLLEQRIYYENYEAQRDEVVQVEAYEDERNTIITLCQ
ncbi:MAG: hypothetical protein J6T10_18240 [Methanobrevibacter sp.]|nr:hypothetical protein [Methanobrevibacter sp.]